MRKARALVVDDSRAMRGLLKRVLEDSGEFESVLEAEDGELALRLMREREPDVVICDVVMPKMGGARMLELRAAIPSLASIPVIMLTASDELERKVDLLDRGAADYVTKPFDPRELLARVRVHMRVRLLQEELRRSNDRLRKLACTDPLLDIFNRRHFDDVVDTEVARVRRYGGELSVVLLDIDHFKTVNDRFGHDAGDAVLRRVARAMSDAVRRSDVVARYGGEEFVLILSATGGHGACTLAERVRTAIQDLEIAIDSVTNIRVTVSLGVAEMLGAADSTAEMLKRADEALYAAKRSGRNRVCSWSSELRAQARPD